MAWSRDTRKPTRYMRGSKRYNDVGGHSPPGDELENTRDHERIWFELKRSRSCCECEDPGFKYCFQTFDWPSYICDGEFPGGDTLYGYWPGTVSNDSSWKVDQGCAGSELRAINLEVPTNHTSGSWRNGPYYDANTWATQWNSAGVTWANFFPNNDRTLEAWIKPTASDIGTGARLIHKGTVGDPEGGLDVYYRSDGSVGLSHFQIAGGALQQSGPGWWEADQWHHFVLVRNTVAQSIAIFINGRLALSRLLPTTGWSVGTFPSTPTLVTAAGAWADIAYYTSALSPSVIRKHYQSVYGVDGVANPLASEGVPIEDPTTVITESIQIDIIDGGGDGQVGYIPVSQGDYTAFVSPEDSPFELEERKSQADGYASLDSTTRVPTAELGTGSASALSWLRGDRTWRSGAVPPAPTAFDQMIRADASTSEAYLAALPGAFTTAYQLYRFTEASAPFAPVSGANFGNLSGYGGGAPSKSQARDIAFHGEDYLLFDGTDGLQSAGIIATFTYGFAFWVRLDELPASTKDLIRLNTDSGMRVRSDGKVEIWGYGSAVAVTSTDPLPVGEWVHLAYTVETSFSAQTRLYVNGVFDVNGSSISNTGNFTLYVGGDGLQFSLSNLSPLYVQGSALSAPAMLALYTSRGVEWQAVDEVVGGVGGVDVGESGSVATAAPRPEINLIEGANVSITLADDPTNDKIDVTIAATSPAGSGIEVSAEGVDVSASPRGRIDFVEGANVTLTVTDDGANDKVVVEVEAVVPDEVPDPSGETDGRVLTVDTGAAVWADVPVEVPDPSGEVDGQVLTVATGAAVWADPPAGGGGGGGGEVLLFDETLAATQASFDFTSIPTGYSRLRVELSLTPAAGTVDLNLRLNGDSGANYDWSTGYLTSGIGGANTGTSDTRIKLDNVNASQRYLTVFEVLDYADASIHKYVMGLASRIVSSLHPFSARWKSNSAVTQLTLSLSSGDFQVGSRCRVYGVLEGGGGGGGGTPLRAQVRRSASQSVSNGAFTSVSFDTEDEDTDGMFAPTSTDVTIQTAGIYQLNGVVQVAGGPTSVFARLAVNGTGVSDAGPLTHASYDVRVGVSHAAQLGVGDVVTLQVYHDSSPSKNVVGRLDVTLLEAGGGGGVEVDKNDADVTAAARGRLNFIEGTGITLTVADDAANDEVDITIAASGGTGTALAIDVAQTAHGFSVGDVLRRDSGTYAKAQADSSANAEVDGIVSAVADANNFTLTLSGEVTGLSGLTDGETYFLSASTAGALTATEPSTTGQVSKPLLRATGTTTGFFTNWRGAVVQ